MDNILFNNILNINNFVFSIVPCFKNPYIGNSIRRLDNKDAVFLLLSEFASGTLSGWCSLNAEFFKMILSGMNVPCRLLNYGIKGCLTHATAIATIDNEEYLFDPYFNKHYTCNDTPIPFNKLMSCIENGCNEVITSKYGPSLKYCDLTDIKGYFSGEKYDNIVMGLHKEKLDPALIKEFGNTNPFNLMRINWL